MHNTDMEGHGTIIMLLLFNQSHSQTDFQTDFSVCQLMFCKHYLKLIKKVLSLPTPNAYPQCYIDVVMHAEYTSIVCSYFFSEVYWCSIKSGTVDL